MDPIDYLKAVRHRWRVVAAAVVLVLVVAWMTTPKSVQVGPPVLSYTASTTLLRTHNSDIPLAYAALFAKVGKVPQQAAERLGHRGDPALLAAEIDAAADDQTGSLTITASDEDGERAAALANTFATELIEFFRTEARAEAQAEIQALEEQLEELSGRIADLNSDLVDNPDDIVLQAQRDGLASRYGVVFQQLQQQFEESTGQRAFTVLQEATPIPVVSGGFAPPSSRSGRLGLGLVLGLALGLGLALVLDRLDTRMRGRATTQRHYRLPVLAEVPPLPRTNRQGRSIAAASQPGSAVAEAYRTLRSALLLMPSRFVEPIGAEVSSDGQSQASAVRPITPPNVVLVTSARSGEGKTTTVANLAVTLAEAGKRVLVLDCDFRAPEAHRYLDVPNGPGLSDLLSHEHREDLHEELLRLCRPTAAPGVRLVTAGTVLSQPARLPTRMAEIVRTARSLADVVLLDSAPMLMANDAIDLMPCVDSVVVVSRSGRTTIEHAERASELLARMHVPVLGVALIGAQTPSPLGLLGARVGHNWSDRPYSDRASAGAHVRTGENR